jgi:hypothetical protein
MHTQHAHLLRAPAPCPGEYYPINLLQPPFNVRTKPLEIIDERSEVVEKPTADKKFMLLFDMSQLEWDDDLAWVE